MSQSVESRKAENPPDWGTVVEQAIAGDRLAYARLARLVTGHLAHWRAYDFRADWDDMVQEVLVSVVRAHREGRLDEPGAHQAYLRQATRFKFIDCIRASGRRPTAGPSIGPGEPDLYWPPNKPIRTDEAEIRITLARAVEQLPEAERLAVYEVHVRGRTYDEAAATTGIPLGSLKRALRTGLARLRRELDAKH